MMTLHAFLIFWNWFNTHYTCTAYNHQTPIFGGSCSDAFRMYGAHGFDVKWTPLH